MGSAATVGENETTPSHGHGHMDLDSSFRPALAALLLAMAPALVCAQDVALVVDRTGSVTTIKQGAPTSIQVLAALPVGTRIQLQGAATVTLLYLQSGDEYTLSGPGESELRAASPVFDAAKMRKRASAVGQPVQLRADKVIAAGVVMRSGGPRPLHPAGQVIARPTRLAWSSLLGDARFRVELRDAGGALLMQQQTTGLSLALPADLALLAGKRYEWSVAVAENDAATAATSSFEMADAELRSTAIRMKPAETASFPDRVVYGLWPAS